MALGFILLTVILRTADSLVKNMYQGLRIAFAAQDSKRLETVKRIFEAGGGTVIQHQYSVRAGFRKTSTPVESDIVVVFDPNCVSKRDELQLHREWNSQKLCDLEWLVKSNELRELQTVDRFVKHVSLAKDNNGLDEKKIYGAKTKLKSDGKITDMFKRKCGRIDIKYVDISPRDQESLYVLRAENLIEYWTKKVKNQSADGVAVACFDFDQTLVVHKNPKLTHIRTADDQVLFDPSVGRRIRAIDAVGCLVVAISNQKKVHTSSKTSPKQLQGRVAKAANEIGIPLLFVAATQDDDSRKPGIGMWEQVISFLREDVNKDCKINYSRSFFVGDAAGRPAGWKAGAKKDFSNSDRAFAANVGIQFYTPDEWFLGLQPSTYTPLLDLKGMVNDGVNNSVNIPGPASSKNQPEIVLFCGPPASGKSTFYKRVMSPAGYVHANLDTEKSRKKVLVIINDAIEQGRSVVVDETCRDAAVRATYVDIAKKRGVPIRCFFFEMQIDLAKHLDAFRNKCVDPTRQQIGSIAFASYFKNATIPTLDEGFSAIEKVSFIARFDSDDHAKRFQLYYP